ncbi:poly-beta-1,6-N-acetyl-D-glucosamine biosynthesis protein PgaD [Evansella vedderi]|uniref:Poly-beta-1,6-N-acetyl-D-glucosamine biosynthesis protein PgaD n=1 Tax=Evansella vedderi TaxID=38282 RepID=A0ABU0A178_9BACI|nr:poly-beta-1,6-N-acetyl-D-glucosamine biosynthesis protein PgaD [Evansella vedderi]MDQ0257000.1 poly-beta-1,6-N-acetyl-D-glucosamine biosynthesis protein PgaD [Evansella vedderi]
MIIDGRANKPHRKAIEGSITFMGWTYVLIMTFQIIISLIAWYFNLAYLMNFLIFVPNIQGTISIIIVTLVTSIVTFLFLYTWAKYNKKRFGILRRRSFPKDVDNKELEELFQISAEELEEYQKDKIIVIQRPLI